MCFLCFFPNVFHFFMRSSFSKDRARMNGDIQSQANTLCILHRSDQKVSRDTTVSTSVWESAYTAEMPKHSKAKRSYKIAALRSSDIYPRGQLNRWNRARISRLTFASGRFLPPLKRLISPVEAARKEGEGRRRFQMRRHPCQRYASSRDFCEKPVQQSSSFRCLYP